MYKNKKIIHIVATGINGEIGFNNKLLWNIPNDLQFFKKTTLNNVVLMGRKTIESLPKPLQERVVITITQSEPYSNFTLEDWLDKAITEGCNVLNTDCIYIAGGASIYKFTENIVDEVLLTKVDQKFENADTFYKVPSNFKLVEISDYAIHKELPYRFTRWISC